MVNKEKLMRSNRGFTLVEVLIAAVILVLAIVAMLGLLTHSLTMIEGDRLMTRGQNRAVMSLQNTIIASDYETLRGMYTSDGALMVSPEFVVAFLPTPWIDGMWNPMAMGAISAEELPGAAHELMRIKLAVCYRHKNRIIGEDNGSGSGIALSGMLEGTEDANGNGEIDSPCQFEIVIVNEE
jgi:hypothetical protein